MHERDDERTEPDERRDGYQNPVIHEGADADPIADTNERADDRATIRDPDDEAPVDAAKEPRRD